MCHDGNAIAHEFQVALARYVLRDILPEALPQIAAISLVKGMVSESLAALAGAIATDSPSELRVLFEQSLRELRTNAPSPLVAAHFLKREYAHCVVEGLMAPRSGAAEIVNLYRAIESELDTQGYVGEAFGISDMVGTYYGYDDVDSDDQLAIAELDEQIRCACANIAAETSK